MNKLWYQSPAKDWYAALPLGNGRIGAMIYGDPINEKQQLNEETIWSGGYIDRNNPDAPVYRDQLRRELKAGRIGAAERLAKYSMMGLPASQTVYQTAGQIQFEMADQSSPVTQYGRDLDLNTAIAHVDYQQAAVEYHRESFISAPANVFVTYLTASVPGKLSFSCTLNRGGFWMPVTAIAGDGPDELVMTGGAAIKFATVLKIKLSGGQIKRIGQYLIVEEADAAMIVTTIATDFRVADPLTTTRQTIAQAMQARYPKLRQAHIDDYAQYYDRVQLDLHGSPSALPIDTRLAAVKQGLEDTDLINTYFNFGRYLLISSSRPGTLPTTLQGIWNQDLVPMWGCKFTININTEMNYWPVESANLPELHMSLFEHMRTMYQHGVKTAAIMYRVGGWVAHHNTDVWGDTAPQDIHMPAATWCLGAAWLCTHIWTHYQYTEDQVFLTEYFYLIQEAVRFFCEYLVLNDAGQYIVDPSLSPENAYRHPATGEIGHLVQGSTMDAQILRDLFDDYVKSCLAMLA